MKKIMCMLLAMALLLCAAGAMADTPPFAISWMDTNRNDTPESGTSGTDTGNDYFYDDNCLYIFSSGLKVSAWGTSAEPATGCIALYKSADDTQQNVELTLENVHIYAPDNGDPYYPDQKNAIGYSGYLSVIRDSFTLNAIGCTLKGKSGISLGNYFNNVSVFSSDTLIEGISSSGIAVAGPVVVTLGGNLTVKGEREALQGSMQLPLIIDGKSDAGIMVWTSENKDGTDAAALHGGKPYTGPTDAYQDMQNARYIRTEIVNAGEASGVIAAPGQTGGLPRTGDESRFVLWLCLLGIAGAGLLILRRRET